jgi:type IV pilus assembly protein PilV
MESLPSPTFLTSTSTGNLCTRSYPRQFGGFSLIEVLVSIVVLSFGLLGMVGMQAAALHANREARLQSSGIVLARELADMIRGNKAVGILASNNPYLVDVESPLAATTTSYCLNVTATTGCTSAAAVANAEMTEWLARVDAELPGARVVSCFDTSAFDNTTGLPQWDCTAPTGTAIAPIVIKIGWTKGATNKSATGAAALDRATDDGSAPSVVLQVTAGV